MSRESVADSKGNVKKHYDIMKHIKIWNNIKIKKVVSHLKLSIMKLLVN